MRTKVKITGLRQLNRRISKLDSNLRRKVYQQAMREAGKGVLKEAKARAPKDSGTLSKSLVSRVSSRSSEGLFGMKIAPHGKFFRSQRTANRRGVGASYQPDWVVRYFRFTELGTKYHDAKPYLLPALKASSGQFFSDSKKHLQNGLKKYT